MIRKIKTYRLFGVIKQSRSRAWLFVVIIGFIGTLSLVLSTAAPFTRAVEPESGQKSNNISLANESGTSDGTVIRFNRPATTPETGTNPPVTSGTKCSLGLHGGGGGGGNYGPTENVQALNPQARNPANGSNINMWYYDGPYVSQYDPTSTLDEEYYQYLVSYLRQTMDNRGCGPTIISGSSNGGAFAAKMYCKGEDFGGRIWAYYMEDPVHDEGILNCSPSPNIKLSFFTHSDELTNDAANMPGFRCSRGQWNWYCENDTTMNLNTYQQRIGQQSLRAFTAHYLNNNAHTLYGNRYSSLPWEFPAELWRTCFNNSNCSRQNYLP